MINIYLSNLDSSYNSDSSDTISYYQKYVRGLKFATQNILQVFNFRNICIHVSRIWSSDLVFMSGR
jgi:abortive infection bacteriophage resistance protein